MDEAARERGVTVYMPDRRSPLHPDAIGEGAASLRRRPAGAASGRSTSTRRAASGRSVERAVVWSRRALAYSEAQEAIDEGRDETLAALREVGMLRLAREVERGGVSLTVPVQEVVREGGGYALRYETPLPVEGWNAQILAGRAPRASWPRGGSGCSAPSRRPSPGPSRASATAPGPWACCWPEGARTARSCAASTRSGRGRGLRR